MAMRHVWALAFAAVVCGAAGEATAQPRGGATRPDANPLLGDRQAVRDGNAMYRTRCAGCHGPDAKGYVGPDLTGLWASGYSDGRIFDIVRRGVPGTDMPPSDPLRVPERDIWKTLAYVKTLATNAPPPPLTGSAENGAKIFQATCSICHIANGVGGHLGPDLSRVGAARSRAAIEKKIRGPNDAIREGFDPVTVVMRDGTRIQGIRKNEDEVSIQLMNLQQRITGISKSSISEIVDEKQSVMPVYGPDQLSDGDLQDLLRYLAGLRGTPAQAAAR
jgi:cytochrome c oxidase cbb3-type subunit III